MTDNPFTYQTITTGTQAEFRDRGSKFIAYTYPLNSKDAVKGILHALKKEHPKAVHHCFAYRLGTDDNNFRANDDGEPSGSAGRPILGQIDSAGLTNTLVVVVRYFGGTLLGVPGLIHAYKTVASDALAQAEKIEKHIEYLIQLDFDYALLNEIMTILKQHQASIYRQDMQLFCQMEVGIPLLQKEHCLQQLSNIHRLEIIQIT